MTPVAKQSAASKHIGANPKFHELVKKRTIFSWTLAVIMLAIYFCFIALVAFDKPFLGNLLSPNGVTTVGFPIGVGVILSAIILTGIYVYRANGEFDELNRQIIEESR